MVGVFRAPAEEDGRGGLTPNGSRSVVPSHLSIADVMEGNLATVLPESSIRSAVRLMIENRISSVPVVDADGAIVGALNEGDLMKVFYEPDTRCVSDVMTRDPIVVSVDANLVEVIDALMSSNFRRVLIRENDLLVGVITRSHVMPALLEALEKGT
jgi:CBS domain-containing protein